jgi:hypothetical protein
MPPLVSTLSTSRLRVALNACPFNHGESGQGMRSRVVRTALMVMSVMGVVLVASTPRAYPMPAPSVGSLRGG